MGVPAWLLTIANVGGCAFVAWMGWLYWALSKSEGNTPGSDVTYLLLGAALLLVAVAMCVALNRRHRLVGAILLALELGIGLAILLRGLGDSIHSDEWLYLLALGVGLTGVGAIDAAESPEDVPG